MFIAFGYILAASASDAIVVEYAQQEPVAIPCRIQNPDRNLRHALARSISTKTTNPNDANLHAYTKFYTYVTSSPHARAYVALALPPPQTWPAGTLSASAMPL
ncbi:hypothetical protein H257_09903 [Aphanomyces astaci]|uniref:Uncharacterized protein n=1 Tax=Aphanomyces astaci TaxID=112090 RepID=W4GA48_APHAT|nr:hypothetical protein H257_09903 [Aphanomyces astaci]ETV75944.1 hypothetical protein H257_09903 [Aphanomyces astaci]|eukprot:XP_009834586.1 hypothetical protein H257_09903 [Aphanomyces astaci]